MFNIIFSLFVLLGTKLVVFISLIILILLLGIFLLIESLSILLIFISGFLIGGTFGSFFKGSFWIISIYLVSKLISDSFFKSHILIHESLPELAKLPSSNSITLYIFPLCALIVLIFFPAFISHKVKIPWLPPVRTFPFFNVVKQ